MSEALSMARGWHHNGRTRHERVRGAKGVAQRKRRLMRSRGLCEWCLEKGRVAAADVVDHIVPLALGGDDTDENTRNLCNECHGKATAEQFGFRHKQRIGVDGWPVD